ncbi:hypothetical protein GCM10023083_39010 [Streptomyces phyllanthi]
MVDERAEHPHPVDLAGQELHDPQFHDLAAVAAIDPGHVHAARHVWFSVPCLGGACVPGEALRGASWRFAPAGMHASGHARKSPATAGTTLLTLPLRLDKAPVKWTQSAVPYEA